MKRRSVEGTHPFAEYIAEYCHIFDLGGLLLDDNGNFTAAVEAFEIEPNEDHRALSVLLDNNGYTDTIYMACIFAEKLGVPFYVFAHIEGNKLINIYHLRSDQNSHQVVCTQRSKLTEDGFIQWWKQKKRTIQTKPYRQQFRQRAETSYFDDLLESHGLKWGGNIDGYLVTLHNNEEDVSAIIENRFTNKVSLSRYDPNNFYTDGGGDYYTWLPLMILKDRLGVPLFLMTYSNRSEEEGQVGITRILGQDRNGLHYIKDRNNRSIRPCDNLHHNLATIRAWISENLN